MSETQARQPAEVRKLTVEAFASAEEAKRRMWAARDDVARIRRQLVDAEQAVTAAERDYTDQRRFLEDTWGYMRSQLADSPLPQGDE